MPRGFNVLSLIGEHSKKYANLPDRFIKRKMERIFWKTPGWPKYLPIIQQKKKFAFNMSRPWTNEFKAENSPTAIPYHHVEPILEWSFFRGDRVQILVGPDKGKQGIIKGIYQERNWVIVEGLNCELKFVGKEKNFPGVPMLIEKPLLVTEDIKHVDPTDLEPTEIEWRFTEDGEKVRVSLRTGRLIPIPPSHDETADYKTPETYAEGKKDTKKGEVERITFKPSLKTFEMDVMAKMKIQEDRIQKPTYWY